MDLMKMVYVIIGITIAVIIAAKAHVLKAHASTNVDSFKQGGKCVAARDHGSDRRRRNSCRQFDVDYTYRSGWNTYHHRNRDDGCKGYVQVRKLSLLSM